MQSINLLENTNFSDKHAHAEPLHVDLTFIGFLHGAPGAYEA